MGIELKNEKEPNGRELGVFEETATLRKTLMWGAPGAEAALALLLPESVSCFWETFDVMGARDEFKNALDLIKSESSQTEIILLKDEYAQMIANSGQKADMDVEELLEKLNEKADQFYAEYQLGDPDQIKDWVQKSVLEDVEKYGGNAAVIINQRLSLSEKLPMANVLYARDQSNMIGKLMIWSSMKHAIRQPEVALFKEIVESQKILDSEIEQVQVTGQGRFEGGDAFVTNGVCYVGIGGRTNWEGINQIAPYVLKQGLRLIVAWDKERDQGTKGEMDAMHLDTYTNIIPSGWVGCLDEMDRRVLFEVVMKDGDRINRPLGSFRKHLLKPGMLFVPIIKADQARHAANFTNLGGGKILLTRSTPDLDEALRRKGLNIINADFQNIGNGAGGTHCSMAPIKRG